MGLLEVDLSNPDLFKPYEPKVLPKGKHTFEVANDLKVESCNAPSTNQIIKMEARCTEDDENKGAVVFHNFILISNPTTEKQRKAKAIHQGALCQFAVACGVRTQADIEEGAGIPLDEFKGALFEAVTRIGTSVDQTTGDKRPKNEISKFLFEPEKAKESE